MQSTTLELSRGERIKTAAKAALPYSAPMIAGFLFLGIAYGIYMKALGFGVLYPMLMALLIYAGSVEFIAAGAL
ncbi:MAG: AzlC family ABC transporter permease, partial [Haemophilus parahaemolyticus]|uniref:AzlC family ABC transporter permease n=1 Tax=Haemophilus parahaemolyticus TaxID=735 RepID=UPI0027F0CE47